ncbi:hypothetical protein [Mycoplasmopsis bovis]|uniref:Uncharacterized protein n=1 Tax=Mycoplasmopsis bovis TaxID=28903 RepID=A0ABY8RYT6_MYCBV|nr:hypothetical protein [Mycoplasmopsis bovis]MBT1315979.1 hypothetical protein [Mycoplasmopsis bovis]MBT1317321.1 hypothetical protein [Mycoplasmopsis bovis]MBT1321091.1 hypothetical protein [Mycoplasmopsis bovis]MBT1325231.1 hypothetical protein [Mycoplasmopsis bovis]MBT1326437.1 hypothetical protein [Mycoplasmopsis bovis]
MDSLIETSIPLEWLNSFKNHLRIYDDLQDEALFEYLQIARKNIWTQFYNFKLINGDIDITHPWANDLITKRATFHLAATYVVNPDIFAKGSQIIDDKNIYRILGDRVSYGAY